MVHSDDTGLMTHTGIVNTHRTAASGMDSAGASKQAHGAAARSSNGGQQRQNTHMNTPRKEKAANRKASSQKHQRRGNPSSEQRSVKVDEDAADAKAAPVPATPTKKAGKSGRKPQRKVYLLTRDDEDNERLSPLVTSAFTVSDEPPSGNPAARKRNRKSRARAPEPAAEPQPSSQRTPPRAGNGQYRPMSTPAMHAPMAHHTASMPALGATPVRNGSPSRSGHYAGASFNNSPAASTLPLPPSFLTTPTKTPVSSMRTSIVRDEDVFGAAQPQNPAFGVSSAQSPPQNPAFGASLASPPQYPAFSNSAVSPPQQHAFMPVAGALNERSRHLDAMLAAAPAYPQPQYMHPVHSYSAVNLAQPSSDMSAMMQKLRLAMTLNERPATVSPMASAQVAARNAHLTPVYNA